MSTALSGHLRLTDLDVLARCNPDIVGVRGAVCRKGDRTTAVAWEAVSEFKHELGLRKTGEIAVREGPMTVTTNGSGWVVVDGRGKSCAGIIAALSQQIERDSKALVEVLCSDVLNTYDLVLWAEKGAHRILTQRKEADGTLHMLVQP
jgi:TusA-related sulfurtransferase